MIAMLPFTDGQNQFNYIKEGRDLPLPINVNFHTHMEIGGREMDFNQVADKPRSVCIPFPAQGHIAPLLKLAKLLHFNGFHITFVSTEYNHTRLLKSRGSNSLDGSPDFRFEAIPDGLPQTDDSDATQGIPSICESAAKNCSVPFRNILHRLDDSTSSPTSSR